MYRAKILFMTIILMCSFIFTLLTVETVTINDTQVAFCRKVEFWCKPPYQGTKIIYNQETGQYSEANITRIEEQITISNGIYTDEYQDQTIIDLPDGTYQDLEGFYTFDEDDNSTFEVLDENIKILGDIL